MNEYFFEVYIDLKKILIKLKSKKQKNPKKGNKTQHLKSLSDLCVFFFQKKRVVLNTACNCGVMVFLNSRCFAVLVDFLQATLVDEVQ